MTAVTVKNYATFFFIITQYFLEEQFDTFDNQCDVLRVAFCVSRDVFLKVAWFFVVERVRDFFCREVA